MKKKNLVLGNIFFPFLLVFYLGCLSNISAQEWNKIIPSQNACCLSGLSVKKLSSGNLLFIANQFKNDSNFTYILKLSDKGDSLWSSSIPSVYPEYMNRVSDSEYIICGFKQDLQSSESNSYIAKIDTLGNILFEKDIQIPNKNSQLEFIEHTSDNGFIACGFITQPDKMANDFFVIKLDSVGNTQWYNNYGFEKNEACHVVHETPEGDFVVSGDSQDLETDLYNIYCIKLNKTGEKIWEKIIGDEHNNGNQAFIITSDNDYVLCGEGDTKESVNFDITLIKLSSKGELKWFKNIGSTGSDAGFFITENQNKEYLITGYSTTDLQEPNTIFMSKINESGNCIGTKFFKQAEVSLGYEIILNKNNEYTIAGRTGTSMFVINSIDGTYTDTFKTYEVKTNVQITNTRPLSLQFYPNPAEDFIYLDTKISSIEIINSFGSILYQGMVNAEKKIDLSKLPSGLYTLKAIDKYGKYRLGKLLKIK